MDKSQALDKFWNSFGIPAYEESTIPDEAVMPYITYEVSTGALNDELYLTASIWYHSNSWKAIEKKKDEIAKKIREYGYYKQKIDDGYMVITQAVPFAQRTSDEDNSVRRIYLNIAVEFLTAY